MFVAIRCVNWRHSGFLVLVKEVVGIKSVNAFFQSIRQYLAQSQAFPVFLWRKAETPWPVVSYRTDLNASPSRHRRCLPGSHPHIFHY